MATEARSFIDDALECSIYAAPTDCGLTRDELQVVAAQMGFLPGEIDDALRSMRRPMRMGQTRFLPEPPSARTEFTIMHEPDLRVPEAFDFLTSTLRERGRDVGFKDAWMDHNILVEKGVAAGHSRHDLEVAFTCYLLGGWFDVQEGSDSVRLSAFRKSYPPSQAQLAQSIQAGSRPTLRKTLTFVQDVIARRTDGRPKSPEPLKAFEEALEALGHKRFRMWWIQTVAELSRTDPAASPMSVCVLSAALSEGALVFIVKHARSLNIGPMMSGTFSGSATQWKFEALLSSAAAGGKEAIFDQKVRDRADSLNTIRQRIHVGRLMNDYPDSDVPDVKPDQAREARETLEQVVRSVLNWLGKHPVPPTP